MEDMSKLRIENLVKPTFYIFCCLIIQLWSI